MTGRNLSDYLLKTRDSFYKRRYGGFEFGVRNPVAARNFTQLQQVFINTIWFNLIIFIFDICRLRTVG